MDSRISYLFAKKLTGEISTAELAELNDCLCNNPHYFEILTLLEQEWNAPLQAPYTTPNPQGLLKKIKLVEGTLFEGTSVSADEEMLSVPIKGRSAKLRWIWYAAAAAIVAIAGWLWLRSTAPALSADDAVAINENGNPNEVFTTAGSQTNITLQDGTKVWLNANSKLTYANDFNGSTREVSLSGEAFFDVVSNKNKPFIIHTSKIKVKVTGTSFNIRAYPDESRTETSLINGKVEVSLIKNPEKIYHLKPSEKLVLKDEQPVFNLAEKNKMATVIPVQQPIPILKRIAFDPLDSIPVETAWLNRQLAFYEETLREVADKMEKWYGVNIEITKPGLEKMVFTGKFENETLEEALEALKFIGKFNYRINQKTVIISN
jgi:ferric-dicitrate binding protein FerR (iron transport regulator)